MAIVVVVGWPVLVAKGPRYVLAFGVQMVFVVAVELVAVLFVVHDPIVVEGAVLCLTTPVAPAARNVLAAVIAMTVVHEGVLAVALVVVVVVPGKILDIVAAARQVLAAVIRE